MKVGSHLKQKICLGSAVLALLQAVSSFPTYAVPLKETTTLRSFADWCLNRESLSPDAKHTVEVLLQKAGTNQCDRASKQLSTLTELSLSFNEISDLKPLSNLTNLTALDLWDNQMLTNKTCPVKPDSICNFSTDNIY